MKKTCTNYLGITETESAETLSAKRGELQGQNGSDQGDDASMVKINKTNKCNIDDDQKLAEQVRKYPCLYDKLDSGYKDLDVKSEAWNTIDLYLEWEAGTSKRQFEILKKRYSRKRVTLKAALRSEIGAKDVASAQKDLEEYSWLSWLDQHIRLYRKHTHSKYESQSNPDLRDFHYPHLTNINFSSRSSYGSHMAGENGYTHTSYHPKNHEGTHHSERVMDNDYHHTSNHPHPHPHHNISRESEDVYIEHSTDEEEYFPEMPPVPHKKRRRIKTEETNEGEDEAHPEDDPQSKGNKKVLATIKMDVLSSIHKLFEEKSDQDDLFGRMIAGELKTFPENLKYRLKHEINTVIFNYKMMHNGNTTEV